MFNHVMLTICRKNNIVLFVLTGFFRVVQELKKQQ